MNISSNFCTLFVALIIAFISMMGLFGCDDRPLPASLTPVTVQLSWLHQAQFAGLYAAEQNGDYAAAGLSVTLVEGGPALQSVTAVMDKSAQFGIAAADQLLLWRADGQPVRAIATIYRRSPRVYIALADSGITRPQDFVGKVISVNRNGRPLLDAMMANLDIAPDQYTVVESKPGLDQFYSGEVQVRSVFLINEVIAARKARHDINVIYPDDYRLHFYGDTVFTSDELIATNPDLVQRFLQASLQGWIYALENPTEIGSLVAHHRPQADPAFETEKMVASLPLINTGEDFIGWMKPEVWASMEHTLREQNILTEPITANDAYTLQFLQHIYRQ